MKYLKKFESINNYYTEISYGEFTNHFDIGPLDMVSVSKKATEIIKKYSGDNFFKAKFNNKRYYLIKSLLNKDCIGNISEFEDEWFMVQFMNPYLRYYKCAQLEGLEQCLEDYYNDIKNFPIS